MRSTLERPASITASLAADYDVTFWRIRSGPHQGRFAAALSKDGWQYQGHGESVEEAFRLAIEALEDQPEVPAAYYRAMNEHGHEIHFSLPPNVQGPRLQERLETLVQADGHPGSMYILERNPWHGQDPQVPGSRVEWVDDGMHCYLEPHCDLCGCGVSDCNCASDRPDRTAAEERGWEEAREMEVAS